MKAGTEDRIAATREHADLMARVAAELREQAADLRFADTSLPTNESFSVFDGPQAGLRFGGVAFAAAPEPSTWAMMLVGFAGLGYAGYRRARKPRAA